MDGMATIMEHQRKLQAESDMEAFVYIYIYVHTYLGF